jgi:hypothetical protein
MTGVTDDEQPWMPEPAPTDPAAAGDISSTIAFAGPAGRANINRAPQDRVSGVIYKRAANIRRVRYALVDVEAGNEEPVTAPEYQGAGEAYVRWVFSEQPGSEEALLDQHAFRYFQDVELLPGASTGERAHAGWDTVLYVIAGEGGLLHRPSTGSPNIARPLRPFDAVLIREQELFRITNGSDAAPLRLIILGLAPSGAARRS